MKHYRVLLLTAIALVGCIACSSNKQQTTTNTNNPTTPTSGVVCGQENSPVCGVDGVTYDNACIATEQHHIVIATQGECPPRTSLTDSERTNLFWLLHERQVQKLPDVSIKLLKDVPQPCVDLCRKGQPCGGCYDLYYAWGQPQIEARIQVRNGKVISAVDTTGYDYVAQKQGAPTAFPELSK